jgi:hypothetical protein
VFSSRGHVAAAQPGFHLGLGGGGLAHLILRLFIWHEIFRLFRYLWRIPTFGPFIVVALGIILIGLLVWRNAHGPVRLGRRRRGGPTGGPTGPGGGPGPRDW